MLVWWQTDHGVFPNPFFTFTPSFRLTERDRFLLQNIARLTLTTRLVREICKHSSNPFASPRTYYRRLTQLREAGFIKREKLLHNGEFHYYLTKKAAGILEPSIEVPRRACSPVRPTLQEHEFDLSRYWIKFLSDCGKLSIPVVGFQRDGQFVFHSGKQKLVPDGMVVLRIRNRNRAFFVEMDRSTQTSGVGGKRDAVMRQKFRIYRRLIRDFRNHPDLRNITSVRLMIVCLTEARLENLRLVASDMNLPCMLTCLPRIIETSNPNTAWGWEYKKANLLAAPLFSSPSRSPPGTLF